MLAWIRSTSPNSSTRRTTSTDDTFRFLLNARIGVASYGALGHVPPPLDLQQLIFFQCTLTCTKSGSDYMSTVAPCKKTVNFFKCPSWHQILPTPLNARLLLADWVEPHVGSKTSLQSNLAKGRIAVLSPPRRRMQSSDLDRPSNKWFFGPT